MISKCGDGGVGDVITGPVYGVGVIVGEGILVGVGRHTTKACGQGVDVIVGVEVGGVDVDVGVLPPPPPPPAFGSHIELEQTGGGEEQI